MHAGPNTAARAALIIRTRSRCTSRPRCSGRSAFARRKSGRRARQAVPRLQARPVRGGAAQVRRRGTGRGRAPARAAAPGQPVRLAPRLLAVTAVTGVQAGREQNVILSPRVTRVHGSDGKGRERPITASALRARKDKQGQLFRGRFGHVRETFGNPLNCFVNRWSGVQISHPAPMHTACRSRRDVTAIAPSPAHSGLPSAPKYHPQAPRLCTLA